MMVIVMKIIIIITIKYKFLENIYKIKNIDMNLFYPSVSYHYHYYHYHYHHYYHYHYHYHYTQLLTDIKTKVELLDETHFHNTVPRCHAIPNTSRIHVNQNLSNTLYHKNPSPVMLPELSLFPLDLIQRQVMLTDSHNKRYIYACSWWDKHTYVLCIYICIHI